MQLQCSFGVHAVTPFISSPRPQTEPPTCVDSGRFRATNISLQCCRGAAAMGTGMGEEQATTGKVCTKFVCYEHAQTHLTIGC